MFPAGVAGVRVWWFTTSAGLRMRVAEAGDPAGRAALLLHGWGASIYMWRAWFQPLGAAGRRVLAVDLPGHGLSDKPDDPRVYRLASLAAALTELMDKCVPGEADVVAQSMAGTIAIELATAKGTRVRRLVLVNPASFGRIRLHRIFRAVSPSAVDAVLPRLVARWIIARTHRMVYGDPSRITTRDEDEYWAPSQFPAFARAMRRLVHEFPWVRPPAEGMAQRLRSIASRTLVVLGTRDRLVLDAQPYVAAIQGHGAPLTLALVPGGGHAVNEERAAEVVELTLRFLA
jgi:pimeloyl-ACP methyl ester carboxylesterase